MKRPSNIILLILMILFISANTTTYKADINVSASSLAGYMGEWYETTGNDIELYFTTYEDGTPEITISLLGTEGYLITDLTYYADDDTYYFVAHTKYLDRNDPDSNAAIGVMRLYGNAIQMEIHYTSNPAAQSYVDCSFFFESQDPDDDYPEADPYGGESGTYDPYTEELKAFYGVWIGASRSLAQASIIANNLYLPIDNNPQVMLSTEWGNLNESPWFCITVDKYASQAAAESVLGTVQNYFPDAYVRYSGEYIGE